MKKSIAGLVAMAGLSCCTAAQAQVVISAVYGGGSSTSTTFLSEFAFDFVELKNNGNSPVTLTGYSLQRRSATGMASFNDKINLPSITIPANGFYLVRTEPGQTGTCGAGAPCRPVPADFFATTGAGGSGQLQLGGTSSVVALLSNQTLLTGCPSNNPAVIDLVGYGNGSTFGQPVANCSETLPCNNTGNEFTAVRLVNGCQDTNNNAVDFVIQGSQYTPRNAGSAPAPCTGGCPADCNTNGTCDNVEINAAGGVGGIGGTLDCNNNGQLDSCEILSNPQIDCNGNGVIDSCELNATTDCNSNGQLDQCEIAANPSLDCDGNNLLDVCQITANPTLDCDSTGRLDDCERVENPSFYDSNNNGINDGCETPGPGQDCNGNNRLDSWDLRVYTLTDVDANGIPDTCEGAVYVEVPVNATVQVGGVRSAPNGERFINIEGATFAEFASYAGLRWSNATVMNGLGATDSVGRVYLRLVQSNAGFTNSGTTVGANDMDIFYSNNDAQSFTAGNSTTILANFTTNFADRQSVAQYDFVRGTNNPPFGSALGSGTIENYKLFDVGTSNTAGGISVKDELESRTGQLTVLLNAISGVGDGTAATYAGWDHLGTTVFSKTGPALVVFPVAGTTCNDLDFNNDGASFDPTDIDALLSVFSEGPCIPDSQTCDDLDFNNDGSLFDPCDIASFLVVFSEGPCTPCGQ